MIVDLGGISAKLAGARYVILAVTGLGYLWSSHRRSTRLMRGILRRVVGRWLRGPRAHFLFENSDDPVEFGMSPTDQDVTIVPGAGVDPANFPMEMEPPSPPVKFAIVSRMIALKGIAEAVQAVRLARNRGAPVELNIYGAPDPDNPSSISEAILRQWSSEPGISWHGPTSNVANVWREHHAALFLTSYREGAPRTLIEAAAAGRPIITTNVVGCREIVRDGQEGLLVPAGDIDAAANAIETLTRDSRLRLRLGKGANARFQERFTEAHVRLAIARLYSTALAQADGG